MSSYKFINITIEDHLLTFELNRPEVKNAFNAEMIREIKEFFSHEVFKFKHIRLIKMIGSGSSFCAGGDLEWMKSMVQYSYDENKLDATELANMFEAIANSPIPTLAFVNGAAMGGGVGIMSCCDFVVAVEKSQFAFSEVRLGLVPAVIMPYVLKKVPTSFAYQYMLTGSLFDTEIAKSCGLVHFTGSKTDCEKYVENILHSLFECGPEAVADTKSLLQFCLSDHTKVDKTERCIEVISKRRISSEGQEGLKSFLNKSRANWKVQKK